MSVFGEFFLVTFRDVKEESVRQLGFEFLSGSNPIFHTLWIQIQRYRLSVVNKIDDYLARLEILWERDIIATVLNEQLSNITERSLYRHYSRNPRGVF